MPFDETAPVSSFFSLSYANYLVLPRSVMQAMPLGWQRDMVKLLEEAGEQFGHLYEANEYDVNLVLARPEPTDDTNVSPIYRPDPLADYRYPIPELVRPSVVEDEGDDDKLGVVVGLIVLAFLGLTVATMYLGAWAIQRNAELRAAGAIP